jgi:phage tail-like protein
MADAILRNVRERNEPALGYIFEVRAAGFTAGFSKISGISEEYEVIDMRDGTNPLSVRKIAGLRNTGEVLFEKGLISEPQELVKWYTEVRNLGRTLQGSSAAGFTNKDYRRDLEIRIGGCDGNPVRGVKLQRAWPKGYTLGDLDAKSSEVAIETLTVVFDALSFQEFGDDAAKRKFNERPPVASVDDRRVASYDRFARR